MTAPSFGTLFSQSWAFFQKNIVVIIIGVVLLGALHWFVNMQMANQAMGNFNGFMRGMPPVVNEFGKQAESDPAGALQKMMDKAQDPEYAKEMEDYVKGQQEAAMALGGMFGAMSSAIIFGVIVSTLLGLITTAYFTLVAVRAPADVGAMMALLGRDGVKIIALSIWTYIRTFAWIPIIGIIPAIILGPRFVLGPLFLLERGKGVTQSVSMSYSATQGLWWTIVKNVIIAGIIIFVATAIVSSVLSGIGLMILVYMVRILGMAFFTVFWIMLARSVMPSA